MLPWSADLAGRIDEHVITSELLRDNPLGDPYERPLLVYVPPGYDDDQNRRYPSVYVIQGYTGHLTMWANRMPYRQPFPETADALFAAEVRSFPGRLGIMRPVGCPRMWTWGFSIARSTLRVITSRSPRSWWCRLATTTSKPARTSSA